MTDKVENTTDVVKAKPTTARIFDRENIALFIGSLALIVSYLEYTSTNKSPRLSVSGVVWTDVESKDTSNNADITIRNLGDKVATGVVFSQDFLLTKSPKVNLVPPRHYTSEVINGVLHVRIDSLDAGDELYVSVHESVVQGEASNDRRIKGYPYLVHVSCNEGSDHTNIISER